MLSPRQITATVFHVNKMVDEGVMTSELTDIYRLPSSDTHRLANVNAQLNVSKIIYLHLTPALFTEEFIIRERCEAQSPRNRRK
jgi:hypothetical protein